MNQCKVMLTLMLKNLDFGPKFLLKSFITLTIFLTKFLLLVNAQSKTIMQDGKWLSNVSVFIVTAEINNKLESVVLPRLEFLDDVSEEVLNSKIKEGIKSQGAVFHLFHDGTGKLIRVNNMLFSQDVFLKDLKQTYTGFLRSQGYKFRVNKKPAYEDSEYLSKIQQDKFLKDLINKNGSKKTQLQAQENEKMIIPNYQKQMGSDATNFEVKTIWDTLPAGVIHPSTRKMKEQIENKLKEIKNRPFEREKIVVEPLRWASGKMGKINEDGTIEKAYIEGQICDLKIILSKNIVKNWYEKIKAQNLENANCEFILFRNKFGSDLYFDNKYYVADIYFVDDGSTFSELFSNDISYIVDSGKIIDKLEIATRSVELSLNVEYGKFIALKALSLAEVKIDNKTEIIRVTASQSVRKAKNIKKIIEEFNKLSYEQDISISFIMSPDGSFYKELEQKRARRIFFPKFNKTLLMLLDEVAEKISAANK